MLDDDKLYAVRLLHPSERLQGKYVGQGGKPVDDLQAAQISSGKNLRKKARNGSGYYKEFPGDQEAVEVRIVAVE